MKIVTLLALGALIAISTGCNDSAVEKKVAGDKSAEPASTAKFLASSEPANAIPVGDARQDVKDDEEVTVVGIIGGSTKPFVEGLAAFTIVDPKVPYCQPDEGCATPWDYCCTQDQVKDNIATVKFVDEAGKPVTGDARELLNVKELSTVVIQGKAKRDDQGNLSLLAQKIFVRPN